MDTEISREVRRDYLAWNSMFAHKALLRGGASSPVLENHSGLTCMTLTFEVSSSLEDTSNCWKSSPVMMKTMEEELNVTLFLGRSLVPHEVDTTMGRMGRSTGARGRSFRLRCSQESLEHSREQSSCSRHRRNWEMMSRRRRRYRSEDGIYLKN